MNVDIQACDLAVFYDDRYPLEPETSPEPPVNRIAIIVNENGALSLTPGVRRKRVEHLPLSAIPKLRNLRLVRPPLDHRAEEIAAFFLHHADRPPLFEAGLRALRIPNFQPLLEGFFPERVVYCSSAEYERAWLDLKKRLLPADLIVTRDLGSNLSAFIAWATDGVWSHAALYVGSGEIHESVTSGVRACPIETYKGQRYWVGAYRLCGDAAQGLDEGALRDAINRTGFRRDAYNYAGAARAGWRAFRGDHSRADTPNSMVLQGTWTLIGAA